VRFWPSLNPAEPGCGRPVDVLPWPGGLDEHADVVFDAARHLAMDTWAPQGAHDLPVSVSFHGGRWQPENAFSSQDGCGHTTNRSR
jgi:hypothetical protein